MGSARAELQRRVWMKWMERILSGKLSAKCQFSSIITEKGGYGLMGKVASDKCHKWVFKEPSECEPNISNYWQSSFDALPSEWTDQFDSGIQTIAVIQAGHGLLQLGSCKIIPEDLHFVLRMRHTFESLGYQSGFYLSQLFSSTRTATSSSTVPSLPIRPPSPIFNWGSRPPLSSPNFQTSARFGLPPTKDSNTYIPHSSESQMEDMIEGDIKWPNGLSFFNALTGQAEEAKLLFHPDQAGKHDPNLDAGSGLNSNYGTIPSELLSLDGHSKMESKLRRSFTLASSSSTSLEHHPEEYRSGSGMYNDVMETFLE